MQLCKLTEIINSKHDLMLFSWSSLVDGVGSLLKHELLYVWNFGHGITGEVVTSVSVQRSSLMFDVNILLDFTPVVHSLLVNDPGTTSQ